MQARRTAKTTRAGEADMTATGRLSRAVHFCRIFNGMVTNAKRTDYECPICKGRGRVPGRLPGRTRLCHECHGTGRVTPIRREALLKRLKQRQRV
jgi:DnaJ-class molecular chaperone